MTTTTHAPLLRMVWPNDMAEIDLAPLQGLWTVEQYLALTSDTNWLVEYTDGVIEVLPIPTDKHQAIALALLLSLLAFVRPRGGTALYAPLRVEVRPGKFREPDLLVLLNADDPRRQNAYWLGADIVVEIVSPDRPERDTEEKPLDYAEAGIPEYWIVNPLDDTITVLTLVGDSYAERAIFRRGERAASKLLDGFSISVDAVFDTR